jgi:tetratricopeptide (TPR) repeat protein
MSNDASLTRTARRGGRPAAVFRCAAGLVVASLTAAGLAPSAAAAPPASRPATQAVTARLPTPPYAARIRFFEARLTRDPDDVTAQNQLAGEYLRRFRDTGDDNDLSRTAKCADRSLAVIPAEGNVGGLTARALAAIALHRFAAARDDAKRLVDLSPGKSQAAGILGDALLELGDYDAAAAAYATLERPDDTDAVTEVRLARLALARGDVPAAARRLGDAVVLAAAADPPVPELLAWAHVQAGQVAFGAGQWDDADRHYAAALAAKPDDWPALDHVAELRAAQGRFDEAIAGYERLVARVPRPELFQALGDVYAAARRADAAATWHARAAAAYHKAVDAGATQYDHHLAGFYCDAMPDPAEAVKWARKDLAARHGTAAHDGLAWALYQAGEFAPAAAAMDQALASGTADSHVLYHASLIYYRAGDAARGRDCLRRAAAANPKFMSFHVHR